MRPFESESRVAVRRSLRQIVSLQPPVEVSDVLESKLKLENYRGERTKRMTPRMGAYHGRQIFVSQSSLPPSGSLGITGVDRPKSQIDLSLRQRIHEQNLMYIRFAGKGFIPPPWKAYGRRHREEIDALRGNVS